MVYVRSSSTFTANWSYHLGYDKWNTKDLTGCLLGAQQRLKLTVGDRRVFSDHAIGKPLWPEYWKLEELEAVKASTGVQKWNAQYMQNPTSEEGAIIKREWWVQEEEYTCIEACHTILRYSIW